MSSLLASLGVCWAIGLGVAAVLLACAAVSLLIYVISAFIIGLAVRLMSLGQKSAAEGWAMRPTLRVNAIVKGDGWGCWFNADPKCSCTARRPA